MKILIVAPDFYPTNGGYANAINNLVDCLSHEEGLETIVFTPISIAQCSEIQKSGVSVVRFSVNKFLMVSKIWEIISFFKIKNIVRKKGIDVVFFETAEFGLLGYLSACFLKNVAVRIHACTETEVALWGNRLYDRFHSFFIKMFFRKVKWIFSTSQYHIEFYKRYFLKDDVYKIARKVFFVIPNVISEKEYPALSGDRILFEKYKIYIDKDQRLIFGLGRLDSIGFMQKGFEDLIYAVYLIKDEKKELYRKLKIVLVGNGEYTNHVLNLIRNLDLSEAFVLVPKMDHQDVIGFMHLAASVVLLSRFEGLSMFGLEALFSGSPLIFSRTGGISDLVVHGKNGYLVQSQNIEEIKNAILNVLELESNEIMLMKRDSKLHFQKHFSSLKTTKKFMSAINLISKYE